MLFSKAVNVTVGFGNDALPVKPFNTPLARTTRLASAMALKPITARIGLAFVFETLICYLLCVPEVSMCGARAHSTCGSAERLRQFRLRASALALRAISLSRLDG